MAPPVLLKRGSAAFGIGLLLGGAAFAGGKLYNRHLDNAEVTRACSTIRETESLYAHQREAAAGSVASLSVLGDSYTEGLYLGTPMSAFPYVLGEALQKSVAVHGIGGTGYVAGGPCGGQHLATRLEDALSSRPSTLIIQAGINDRGKDGVREAAVSLLDAAKRQAPETRIVVLGPFAPPAAAGAELDEVAESVEAAATEAGVQYVDPSAWKYPLIGDRLHPSESGHQIIGEQLAEALEP